MNAPVLLDTGPLVAFLDRRDQHYRWAYDQFERLPFPFLTCEAVLTEATHLLKRSGVRPEDVLQLARSGAVRIDYDIRSEVEALQTLLARYRNVPMDLADACPMRMGERHRRCRVLTLDSDFYVYRTEAGDALGVIAPN